MTSNKMTSGEPRIAEIDFEPVELCKLLKNEDLVQSGGEAKFVIAEGRVQVNGELEMRKRRKILDGDRITFSGHQILVRLRK